MKDSLLHSEKVSLRPATPEEIPQFFAWATNPDPEVQRYFYGDKTPTYEEFLDDWKPYYFDGNQPTKGRYYIILAGGMTPIGVVNYNGFDAEGRRVTFDIIIGEGENLGRGYGSDALRTLARHLFAAFSTLETAIIGANAENTRAIRAYEKAGFRRVEVDVNDPYIVEYAEGDTKLIFLELHREDLQL